MNQPLQTCPQCGAGLSLDDLRQINCPYCRVALPHHARAAEHAALVNKMLQQQGVNYQIPYQYGAAPPPGVPSVYGQQVQQSIDTVHKSVRTSVIIAIAIAAVTGLFIVAGVVLALVLFLF